MIGVGQSGSLCALDSSAVPCAEVTGQARESEGSEVTIRVTVCVRQQRHALSRGHMSDQEAD